MPYDKQGNWYPEEEDQWQQMLARAGAKIASPAVDTFANLSASYIPERYAKPLDIFKEMVSPYNMDYTRPGGNVSFDPSGTTYPQYDAAGNVKVYQGQVYNPSIHGAYNPINPQFMALDAPTANFFAMATPEDVAKKPIASYDSGGVPTGSQVRTGVLPPEEIIRGNYNEFRPSWEVIGDDLGTTPGIKEVQISPSEIEKVVSGQGATAKTIHGTPTAEAQKYINKLDTPLPGTGVETSWLGKAGPFVKGAARLGGVAAYPLSAKAVGDYWDEGHYGRSLLAAGSMIPGLPGWLSGAGEVAANLMAGDEVQPGDLPIDPYRFGDNERYAGMGVEPTSFGAGTEIQHPGLGFDTTGFTGPLNVLNELAGVPSYPSMKNAYTDPTEMAYMGITPPGEEFGSSFAGPNTMNYGQPGTQTGMPVAMDAGGAVGGYPGVQPMGKYGESYYQGENIPATWDRPVQTNDPATLSVGVQSPADINAMLSKAYTGTDSVFTGDEVDVAWSGLYPGIDYSAHGSSGSGISPLPAWTGLVTKAIPAVAASTAIVDILANERDRQIAADIEKTTQVDTFASGGQVQPLPEVIQDIVRKNTQKDKDNQKAIAAAQRKADLAEKQAAARRAADAQKHLEASRAAAAKAQQESQRRALEKQMQGWLGRDEQDESAMAQIQAALDHIADLQGTGITSGSTGDRTGAVREAMRSVGYGSREWT